MEPEDGGLLTGASPGLWIWTLRRRGVDRPFKELVPLALLCWGGGEVKIGGGS